MADAPFGPAVARFDAAVDAWLDQIRGNPVADRVFYAASAVGDHSLIWFIAGTARALLPGGDLRDLVELSVSLGVESAVVNLGLKSLFSRARPVHEGEHPHGLRQPLTSSFPSGHASAGFFAAALLSDRRPLPEKVFWYGVAGVVASSRVYVKVHHASDVAAGAAVGIVLGAAAKRVRRNLLARGGVG
ncbi:MAG TPA: phosphatase PAP2 family protein [Acidimicrobiales bacterium]|nr:phosphatase PAP2 family protein [Acidimicrobiales bacterium]